MIFTVRNSKIVFAPFCNTIRYKKRDRGKESHHVTYSFLQICQWAKNNKTIIHPKALVLTLYKGLMNLVNVYTYATSTRGNRRKSSIKFYNLLICHRRYSKRYFNFSFRVYIYAPAICFLTFCAFFFWYINALNTLKATSVYVKKYIIRVHTCKISKKHKLTRMITND